MRLLRRPVSPLDDQRIRSVRPAVLGWRQLAREYLDSAHLLFANERYRDSLPLFRKALECTVRSVQGLEGEQLSGYDAVEEDFFKRYGASSLVTRIDLKETGATFSTLVDDTEREPLVFTSEQIRSLDKAVSQLSTFFKRADRYITFCLTTSFYNTWRRRIATVVLLSIMGGAGAGLLWHVIVNRGSGAQGAYYSDREFLNLVTRRVDPKIDFDFHRRGRPPGLPSKNFSVRWEAHLYAPQSGEYELVARMDDGARLWIDGKKVIDNWERQKSTEEKAALTLERGWHTLKLEYYQREGTAVARLLWKRPNRRLTPIEGPYLKVEPR